MEVSLESPYYEGPGAIWLRGNLHTHTTRSDGSLLPQDAVDKYSALGYDFLMLSDHDTLGEPETLDAKGMLLLRGNEVSGGGSHLLHVGANSTIEPDPDRQQVIDAINADGGFAILCHPNWQEHFNHYTFEKLLSLNHYAGIEIYNGVCLRQPGEARATDKWDRLWAAGKKVWGYGNDDAHRDTEHGLSWTVVRAKERSIPAILEALRAGSCYVSSGVEIQQIRCTGSVLHVVAPNAQAMAVFGDSGARLHYQLGNEISFDTAEVAADHIRVECYGPAGQMAWTQPFTIHGTTADYLRQLGEQQPSLRALPVDTEPCLTGKLDDPLWGKAEASTRFLNIGTGQLPTANTAVKCLVSKDHLFFGIRCQEPQMDKLRTNVSRNGDANIWNDDSVEVFVDAGLTRQRYLHTMVSAAGYYYSVWMPDGSAGPAVRTACWRDDQGYSLEIAIPRSVFDQAGQAGSRWGLHVCRNRKPHRTTYMWAWVGSNNHTPTRYGELVLR